MAVLQDIFSEIVFVRPFHIWCDIMSMQKQFYNQWAGGGFMTPQGVRVLDQLACCVVKLVVPSADLL